MQPTRLATNTRKVIKGEEAQIAIRAGVDLAFDVAKAAYGPNSGNVGIEAQYGDPITSHDGVFNLDHLQVPENGIDYPLGTNMAARILVQASRSTNVHVGDGTTAAAIAAASIYKEAISLMTMTGESRFSVARRIKEAGARAVQLIDEVKIEATPELLHSVAIISSSDEEVGSLISDTIQEVGADGGVIIENFGGAGIYNDIKDGFYFRRGFTNAALLTDPSNLESRFDKVFVLVCEKDLSNVGDIAPILDKCIDNNIHELLLIGSVQTEALAMAVKARIEGQITCTIVDAPEFGALRTLFMDDVALYTGAKILNAGANPDDFNVDMLGAAKAVVTEFSTTLLNPERDEEQEKALQARITELSEELKVAQSPIEQEAVRTRLGRLSGRIAILRVGGSTEIEQQSAKFHVEDAVAAVQAAIKDGVVPGGGVTLARMPRDLPFIKAFEQPLTALMQNSGLNPDYAIWHVRSAKSWFGYDLRNTDYDEEGNPKLVNLQKAGVVDPTLVIKEVVSNACSVAAELIKMTVLMPFDNREAKRG